MDLDTFFIDLDDTVYPASSGIWPMIRQRIGQYMLEKLGIDEEVIPSLRRSLFEKYGTTLRGLQAEYDVDIEAYLAYVHDVPVEERLKPDVELRQVLMLYPQQKFIFTNADSRHAERVLAALEIRECFAGIIDIHQIAPACKPQPYSFQVALKAAGWPNPRRCLFVDDAPHNLRVGREIGFFTVLAGSREPDPAAERAIPHLSCLPEILPLAASKN